jgi:hypothetical protein
VGAASDVLFVRKRDHASDSRLAGPVSVTSLGRARRELHEVVAQYRWPYLALARLKHPAWTSPEPIRAQTELVIEGFPRSGNTFAVAAFRMSQAEPVRVAHHLHAASQVIEAARRGIPAMVLVRDPDAAVVSFALRDPRVSLAMGLRQYCRFHARLFPWRSAFVIVPFDEVIGDFGRAIAAVNDRWGTGFFADLDSTQAGSERIRAAVEASEKRKYAGAERLDALIAVPSETRSHAHERLAAELDSPRLRRLRRDAQGWYRRYLGARLA